jgi:bacterioferritin
MSVADQLEVHAHQELKHSIKIARQVDYSGKMPVVVPKPVRTSEEAKAMLRFDLNNENETIRNYRARVRRCEPLGEFALAAHPERSTGDGPKANPAPEGPAAGHS